MFLLQPIRTTNYGSRKKKYNKKPTEGKTTQRRFFILQNYEIQNELP